MTIPVTVYHRPNGRAEEIEVPKVKPEDEAYIKEHDIKISMEELSTGDIVIYFDHGAKLEDGDPDELIEFANGRTCEDTIAAGVEQIKKLKVV